jgi:hypothetical protein
MTEKDASAEFALKRWASLAEDDLVTLSECLQASLDHTATATRDEARRFIDEIGRELNRRTPLLPDEPIDNGDGAEADADAAREDRLVRRGWYVTDASWRHDRLASTTGVEAVDAERIQANWDVSV